jgi:regulation of enolase protein 1 (concanavalin A-like superfamily)
MTAAPLSETLAGFRWSEEPAAWSLGESLELTTRTDTDYWQRTHYGFQRDNGHFFFTAVDRDFSLTAQVAFAPNAQYDQCGLMCRVDQDTWIKASVEHEPDGLSRLGSVVTNLGYSDWATQDIDAAVGQMWYRLSRRGSDFRLESSADGAAWQQMRIAHLHGCPAAIQAGIYACSPVGPGFQCRVLALELGPSQWAHE